MGGVVLATPSTDAVLRFLRGQRPARTPEQVFDRREARKNISPAVTPRDRLDIDKYFQHREHTDNAVKQDITGKEALAAPDGDVPTTSLDAQIGRAMHSNDIIKRLQKLNSNLVFERSLAFPEIMGIYVGDPEMPERNGRRLRHVVGFEFGFSPEYTVRHPEHKGVKKMTKGYRLLILQLVKQKLINFEAACEAFQLRKGRQSHNWAIAAGQRQSLQSPVL